jgi:hypothetical protein
MRKARSQCWLEGFIRSGSMILKVRASATLRPPAMAGSRASVASPRARSRGGRATQGRPGPARPVRLRAQVYINKN